MKSIMERCNNQKTASRKVSDGCERIFFCLYLKTHKHITNAIIVEINAKEVTIISPEFNFDRKVKFRDFKSVKKDSINFEN